ncbi:hypothetical protein CN539_21520 [Bacillus toyonensis]|uniref:hypothetical protein n=1 Tax=Bacillus toyonensis TaxID=155322 RepID=UPI000BF10775|nr:hypothetical protein [Bacillus toyonensis]MCU5397022.1 hypothetical protein [Bacillus toyonensis]PEM64249.1 hypothetical protein CN625_01795 [Bacillus toyonensis]PEN71880.1 hypothetical protein CN539_21520 [Bacillus toyonensis]QWH48627.1 hypothetical protein EXW64_30670 [Bacillus toyonensis]
MAVREFHGAILNKWDHPIIWVKDHLNGGIWTDPWSPSQTAKEIKPGEVGRWRSESDGFMTGTSGWALWRMSADDHQEFLRISWSVPFIASGPLDIKCETFRFDPTETGNVFQDKTKPDTRVQKAYTGQSPDGGLDNLTLLPLYPGAAILSIFEDVTLVSKPHYLFVVDAAPVKKQPLTPANIVVNQIHKLSWMVPNLSCGTSGGMINKISSSELKNVVIAKGSVSIKNSGQQPLKIQQVSRTSPDSAQMFNPDRIIINDKGTLNGEYDISITATPNTNYESSPYSLEIKIETNGGSAVVNLGQLPPIDDNLAQQIRDQAFRKLNMCNAISDWHIYGDKVRIPWTLPDPAPDAPSLERVWSVQATGLSQGSVIKVSQNGRNRFVGRAITNHLGEARITLLSSSEEKEIDVILEKNNGQRQINDMVGVSTFQMELVKLSDISFSEPIRQLTGMQYQDRSIVVTISDRLLEAREINRSLDSKITWKLYIDGLKGCLPMFDHFLVWGKDGLFKINMDGEVIEEIHLESVIGIAILNKQIWALDNTGMLIAFNINSYKLDQKTKAFDAEYIIGTGNHIILIQGRRYKIWKIDGEDGRLNEIGESHLDESILNYEEIFVITGSPYALFKIDDFYHLIDLSEPEKPMVRTQYEVFPRFLNSVQIGEYWAYQSLQPNQVSVAINGKNAETL